MSEEKRDYAEYHHFFDISHDMLLKLDENGTILDVNTKWCGRLGGGKKEHVGRPLLDYIGPEDYTIIQDLLSGDGPELSGEGLELRLLYGDGSDVWVKLAYRHTPEPVSYYLAFKDISIQRRFEEELHRSELIDELSGAFNRRYFLNRAFEELLRSVRYQSEISLLLINIDKLGEINERYNQYTGDQVIRKSAQICMKTLRNTDLFGRMGAGEFACLLVETPMSGALVIADRIRMAIAENEIAFQDRTFTVSATIGVSGRIEGDVSIEEILSRAQKALREGKQGGGNRVEKNSQ